MAPTNQGNSTETTLSAFLEKVYPQDTVTDELYNECTALAIARKEDFAGTHYIIDVKTAGQGVSASADRQRIGRAVFRALGLHVDPLPPPPRPRGRYFVGLNYALKEPKKA